MFKLYHMMSTLLLLFCTSASTLNASPVISPALLAANKQTRFLERCAVVFTY